MVPNRDIGERRGDIVTIVVIVLSLVIITFFDMFVYPQHNVTVLYAIPVLLGALRAAPRVVLVIAVFSLGVDGINAIVHHHPLEAWLLRTVILVVVDCFAVLIAWQRRELQQRTHELEDANAKLQALEKERAEWTSLVAHDLRQPVTVIQGYASLLVKQTKRQAPDVAKSAEHILASGRQLNRLIVDLLDVSRIAAHRFTIQKRPLMLPTLAQAVIEQFAETAPEHPIHLECHGEIPPIEGDPERITEVLTNLISNAQKYSNPNSEIQVDVARRDDLVEICVTNHGPGVSREELPHLFTRFYRTEEARAGPARGIGLGLYISRGIVEAHGGRIWVNSIPGQTTAFHFTLPVEISDSRATIALSTGSQTPPNGVDRGRT